MFRTMIGLISMILGILSTKDAEKMTKLKARRKKRIDGEWHCKITSDLLFMK